jgi:hypothetical protein
MSDYITLSKKIHRKIDPIEKKKRMEIIRGLVIKGILDVDLHRAALREVGIKPPHYGMMVQLRRKAQEDIRLENS